MKHIGRIKVFQETDCQMDWVCICPHCGNLVQYRDMMSTSGIHNCYLCNKELNELIEFDKKRDYALYTRKANNHEYEPYRYREGED